MESEEWRVRWSCGEKTKTKGTVQDAVTLPDEECSKARVFEGGGVTKVPKMMTTRRNNDRVKISMTTTETITRVFSSMT